MAFVDGLVIIAIKAEIRGDLFFKVARLIYFGANPKYIGKKKVVYLE